MSQEALDAVLTPEEREWAFALEEALYGADEERKRARRAARKAFVARAKQSVKDPLSKVSNHGSSLPTKDMWREASKASQTSRYMPTDFELATHAIVAKGNTGRALKRIKRLLQFKELYRVPDFECGYENDEYNEANIDSVLLVIKKFLLAYPDFIKSIGMDKHGRIACVLRLRGLRWDHPPPFNHTEHDRFKALYCLMHALQPTPESVRRGTVWIVDLGGVTAKPNPHFMEAFRKLLRDSYPMRVQDVPCVRCPPLWSGAFAGTRPFWSRHFGNRFVRVDAATLKEHFPAELLQGTKPKQQAAKASSSHPRHRRHKLQQQQKQNNKAKQPPKPRVVASNGDDYDNTWENLDEDSDHHHGDPSNSNSHSGYDDLDRSEWSDWTSVGSAGGIEMAVPGTTSANPANEELWTKIERLVRMRFHTERTFRVA